MTHGKRRICNLSRRMDAAYCWQKAATCLRLAQTLSVDNPGRLSLLEMAVGFERRAKELEASPPSAGRMTSERPESPRVSRDQAR
jgi:hypothetical protein